MKNFDIKLETAELVNERNNIQSYQYNMVILVTTFYISKNNDLLFFLFHLITAQYRFKFVIYKIRCTIPVYIYPKTLVCFIKYSRKSKKKKIVGICYCTM